MTSIAAKMCEKIIEKLCGKYCIMRYGVHLRQILGLIIVIFNLVHKRSRFCRGAQHAPSRFKRGWIALLLGDSKKILASGHRVIFRTSAPVPNYR